MKTQHKRLALLIFLAVCLVLPQRSYGGWFDAAWNRDATATTKGIVELATDAESITGTDATRAVTPASLKAVTDTLGGADIYAYQVFYIEEAIDGASPPAALSTITSTHTVFIRNFDSGSDEDVDFIWQVPGDFTAGGTITFMVGFFITNGTGPSSEGVAFQLQGASIGTGDALGATLGSQIATNAAAATHAQYDLVYTSWSAAVTVTDLAANETAILTLNRDISDAVDDYLQDVGGYVLMIKYPITTVKQ